MRASCFFKRPSEVDPCLSHGLTKWLAVKTASELSWTGTHPEISNGSHLQPDSTCDYLNQYCYSTQQLSHSYRGSHSAPLNSGDWVSKENLFRFMKWWATKSQIRGHSRLVWGSLFNRAVGTNHEERIWEVAIERLTHQRAEWMLWWNEFSDATGWFFNRIVWPCLDAPDSVG